jgi:hypothetical protein
LTYVISLNNFQSGDNETWVEGLLNGEVIRIFPNGMAMKVDEFQHVRFVNFQPSFPIQLGCFATLLRRRLLIQITSRYFLFPYFAYQVLKEPNQKEIPFSDIWDGTLNSLILYIIQRLEVANNEINEVFLLIIVLSSSPLKVSPKWCQTFLSQILREMSKLECDVTVYGLPVFLPFIALGQLSPKGTIVDSAATPF